MATKNTRNAAFEIADAVNGPYTKVNKTHGLKISMPTNMSADTGHGQKFESYLPGTGDYKLTLAKWYDSATSTLEAAAVNKTKKYFRYYPDYDDPTNYDAGACYIGLNEQNSDLGNTTDQTYDIVLADTDPKIVRNGTVLNA